ncbi:MAG: hypothetical protein JWP44_4209, partial [Mucilaginibacter sp.]|nr:hypothetical protein [Mucilaginibacter sp.]
MAHCGILIQIGIIIMTCIVGIEHNNKVYMGSDSCVTTDTCKTMLAHSKLIQKNQIIFGYAGSPRFSDILKYHMEFPKHEKAMDDKDYL